MFRKHLPLIRITYSKHQITHIQIHYRVMLAECDDETYMSSGSTIANVAADFSVPLRFTRTAALGQHKKPI